ncbi:adenylosuccinate synthase [Salinibacter ruber]|uniref:adenylosuccinate synthase n=1 Tax=Salinibacter ruber TaxID=146919 RepID=UPI002167D840|nr:adenylosuccinate synthase [Salinibacter ruber]MCS3632768.1 adenylosuccinate synthase [Salinibacter ruber]MCS3713457.1 adenylosuccinate synthase [Salinibacter ruber]
MPVSIVIGSQWGDEGKGKIVDLLSPDVDIVARYQGGANAGHTIVWDEEGETEEFVLHLVPSGIFHEGVTCVIGNGVVLDPKAILEEIEKIESLGIDVEGRLKISHNAHLIMPYHKAIEAAQEEDRASASDDDEIGTTGRGIGPAYTDKFARTGIRVVDLLDEDVLRRKLRRSIEEKNAILRDVYDAEALDVDRIVEEYVEFDQKIDDYVTDTSAYLSRALDGGARVLAEGAQGSLLDVDFGSYPYVTSSHPTAGGCCTGLGVSPTEIDRVLGIAKAYCTRVGNGPFPTELDGEVGQALREKGGEFGATTGRPRRCGWLDLVALRYTCMVNGFNELALTKLDILSGIDELKVCTEYRYDGKTTRRFPSEPQNLTRVEPQYETLPGWEADISEVRHVDDLPRAAQDYLAFIENYLDVEIGLVSNGPRRSQIITDVQPMAAA